MLTDAKILDACTTAIFRMSGYSTSDAAVLAKETGEVCVTDQARAQRDAGSNDVGSEFVQKLTTVCARLAPRSFRNAAVRYCLEAPAEQIALHLSGFKAGKTEGEAAHAVLAPRWVRNDESGEYI